MLFLLDFQRRESNIEQSADGWRMERSPDVV